jgi:serine/threonine-protein kinase
VSEPAKSCPQCGRSYGAADRFCTVDGATLIASGAATILGTVIADRFLVQEKLGQGGMGEVYLAEHVRIKRKVALKLMRPWMIGDPVAVGRFHREAENASQISHQHVAQVYDFGESADGLVYLAMEFVDGEPLSTILDREGRLHVVRAVDIARQIAEALAAAHSLGILHRDLKPDNVMVGRTRFGTDLVKLVDFGIARAMDRSTQAFTSTGLIVGTPDYMSPEQMSGDTLDGRSDLYALALITYRCITGKSAYPPGATAEALVARLTRLPQRLTVAAPEVEWPESLQLAFDRALAADPAARFGDPVDFAAELEAATTEIPLGAVEREYLTALSQRQPTPVRSAAISGLSTPVRGATPIAGLSPVPGGESTESTAVATPPPQPVLRTEPRSAIPQPPLTATTHPWSGEITPAELPIPQGDGDAIAEEAPVAALAAPATGPPAPKLRSRLLVGGLVATALVAIVLVNKGGRPAAPPAADSAVDTSAVLPVAIADSAPAVDSTTPGAPTMEHARNATVAIWAGGRRGAGVIVEQEGLVLTSAALVRDAPTIDVFLDQTTRVRATVLEISRTTGLAALRVASTRCRRCAAVEPDTANGPVVGDSLLALPTVERRDGTEIRSAVRSVSELGVPTTTGTTRLVDGTPVFSLRTGALVAIGLRGDRDRTRLTTTTALRDLRVLGRGKISSAPVNDTLYPTWPAAQVPTRRLATVDSVVPARMPAYTSRAIDGFVVLAMTPQVLRWRQSLANPGPRDPTTEEDPFRITPNVATPAAKDPITSWGLWREIVSERRPVVVLNVTPEGATFPVLPARVVEIRGGDVASFYLQRDRQRIVPIDSGTTDAVGNADEYRAARRQVYSAGLAVYSPADFSASGTYEVVITDRRRPGRTVTIPLPPAMLQAIAADFDWLRR